MWCNKIVINITQHKLIIICTIWFHKWLHSDTQINVTQYKIPVYHRACQMCTPWSSWYVHTIQCLSDNVSPCMRPKLWLCNCAHFFIAPNPLKHSTKNGYIGHIVYFIVDNLCQLFIIILLSMAKHVFSCSKDRKENLIASMTPVAIFVCEVYKDLSVCLWMALF